MKLRPVRRRGYALMLVVVQMMLLMGLWGIAYRQLASAVGFINALNAPVTTTQLELKPIARALILLETGDPPNDTYICGVVIQGGNGPNYFQVSFTPAANSGAPNPDGSPGPTQWSVHSIQVNQDDLDNLPSMPYTFGP